MTRYSIDSVTCDSDPSGTERAERHRQALAAPREGFEQTVRDMVRSWLDYANTHEARYESRIGADSVLGPEWAAIGTALLGLLIGDLGRLDAGTLDTLIRKTLAEEGFGPAT